MRRTPDAGDADVRERLRSLAAERHRFGYRRLGILLESEGVSMNKKKVLRLYREEGLAARPAWPRERHRHADADGAAGRSEPAREPILRGRHAALGSALLRS